MTAAIFLGAGASAADGAPTQAHLFREYFGSPDTQASVADMARELATFFQLFFQIDVDRPNLGDVQFPTFEEALGVLDMAMRRGESFRDFDLHHVVGDSDRIASVRLYLVFAMAAVLRRTLGHGPGRVHEELVTNLGGQGISFVTTNYDLLLDNALSRARGVIDYGIEFDNSSFGPAHPRPAVPTTKLLKVHGSLNWVYCPTCRNAALTPFTKTVADMVVSRPPTCAVCGTVFAPLIVPPTFLKDMSNLHLETVWYETERTLRGVDHVVFCGYSFPDADLHIKYLLKRVQMLRNDGRPRFTVCNHHDNKKPEDSRAEELRFKRFLGGAVDYRSTSFEEFAKEPEKVLGSN